VPEQTYQRDKAGIRLDLEGGMVTVLAPDVMKQGYPYLQNVRRNLFGRAISRPAMGGDVLSASVSPDQPRSLIRMNDATPLGPASGYVLIIGGAAGKMYVDSGTAQTLVAQGASGDPLSFVTFRPNASPQPWCYIADGLPVSGGVRITDPYEPPNIDILNPSYSGYGDVYGMVKVRSDGTCYKTGIREPQVPPTVNITTPGSGPNWAVYRYIYRSSETGALSNPSPESAAQIIEQSDIHQTILSSSYATNLTFNPAQYEWDAGTSTFRTKGIGNGLLTDYIIAHTFNLNVPDNVTIDGIVVTLNWAGQVAGSGILTNVALYYQNQTLGLIKSPAVANQIFVGPSGTDTPIGSNSDNWGTVLTPAIVNDSTFGFGVQVTTATSGNTRSFFYYFKIDVYYTDISATVQATASIDPQVDKIDFYRQTPALDNFTYVGTINNADATTGLLDTLNDLIVANNPILQFDNYEPFPSIDLPRKGTVTIGANGILTLASGDNFNIRWLPGTLVTLGGIATSEAATTWTLYTRPFSTTSMQVYTSQIDPTTGLPAFVYPQDPGSAVSYEIAEPDLAAQPSPAIWGPTPDNSGSFYFGLDPLNPGDLLWSKGNNFDSAPDTNRMFVTTPSEPLMNGTITSELSTVFSTERFWLIYPNFADALAAITGTEGQQWTLIQSSATRGLYMRYAIAALGAMIAYRAKDCIALSNGGGPEDSITESIRNLFPQEGAPAQPITIGNQIVYPPDDTKPGGQTIAISNGYIYYDYEYAYEQPDTPLTANFIPASVDTEGPGIPWQTPEDATSNATASNAPIGITSFSITGNVVTFSTTPNTLAAGQTVLIENMQSGTYLNGQTLTVSPTGLSSSAFQASFTHADVASTADAGTATGAYASAINISGSVPLSTGLYLAISTHRFFRIIKGANGTCHAPATGYPIFANGSVAVAGCSLPATDGEDQFDGFRIPDLPAGAVMVGVFPIAQGTMVGTNGFTATEFSNAYTTFGPIVMATGNFSGLFYYRHSDGSPVYYGSDTAAITSAAYTKESEVTINNPGFSVTNNVDVALGVTYSMPTGTPTPADQLQTLVATDLGLSLPTTSPVNGIQVVFNAGMQTGSGGVLSVQLTLNGVPLGTPKAVTLGPWPTTYTLGGASDTWGLGSITGTDVNGANGLGINISGTLPDGAQIDLNGLSGTLFYLGLIPATGKTTLVYDLEAKGWSVDVYNPIANYHLWAVGVNQLLLGCVDGTVRRLGDGGETGSSIIATRSENGDDVRMGKRVGDVFFKAEIDDPVAIALWSSQLTVQMSGFSPTSLTGTGAVAYYIINFTSTIARDVDDIAAVLSWDLGSDNVLDLWQPDWIYLPEAVQDRPSDWDDGGSPQNKFVQGMLLECDTFGALKTFQVESDDGVLHTPVECPFSQNGEAVRSFTFNPPFTAHMVRIVSSDGVAWRFGPSGGWTNTWLTQPYPEASGTWTTEFSSFGLHGFIHCYQINLAYVAVAPVTVTLNTDEGTFALTFPAGGAGTQPQKVLMKCPRNKWKICSFSVSCGAPMNVWKDLTEIWLKEWGSTGEYQKVNPFGGDTTAAATI